MGNFTRFAALSALALTIAAPAAAQDYDPAPLPPEGIAPTFKAPPRDETGAYVTPNRHLSAEETTWHVRSALNVAALACRDEESAFTVATYNAMLTADAKPLAAAASAVEAQYKARHGAAWQARQDDDMTRLYNFFASPVAHEQFCATAKAVLRDAAAVAPGEFAAFATNALPALEQPFLALFDRYDRYRDSMARWSARHEPIAVATNARVALAPIEH